MGTTAVHVSTHSLRGEQKNAVGADALIHQKFTVTNMLGIGIYQYWIFLTTLLSFRRPTVTARLGAEVFLVLVCLNWKDLIKIDKSSKNVNLTCFFLVLLVMKTENYGS